METRPDPAHQYRIVFQAIEFIRSHARRQPSLAEIASTVHLSEYHLQRVFTDWAGISPKRFLQFLTKEHAKQSLRHSADVLTAALEAGLSGSGRLHDLLVTCEAMTPGEIKARGQGVTVRYGIATTPFGDAMIGWTQRGVCYLAFCDQDHRECLQGLTAQWPLAKLLHDRTQTNALAEKIFSCRAQPRKLHLLRVFAVVFFTTALGGLIFQSTTFSLPKVLDEQLGGLAESAGTVGWYAFLVFSTAALAQLLVGYLVDRYSVRLVFAAVAFFQAACFSIMITVHGVQTLFVAGAFMFVVFGQIPINDVLIGRLAHSDWSSRAYALRYVVTFSVMAMSVPLIALVHGRWGFDALFSLLAGAALFIYIAVLFLPKSTSVMQ